MSFPPCPAFPFPSPHFAILSNTYREKGFLGVDFIIVFDIVQMFLSFPYYKPMKKNTSFFSSQAKKKNTSKSFRFPWQKVPPTQWEKVQAGFTQWKNAAVARVDVLKEQVTSKDFLDNAGTVVFAAGALVLGVLQWLAVFVVLIALAKVIAGFVVVFWPILLLGVTLLLAGLAIRASVIDNPLQGLFI